MARRSNRLVVPECQNAINQMKYEIASELGVSIGQHAEGFDTEFAGELGSMGAGVSGKLILANYPREKRAPWAAELRNVWFSKLNKRFYKPCGKLAEPGRLSIDTPRQFRYHYLSKVYF